MSIGRVWKCVYVERDLRDGHGGVGEVVCAMCIYAGLDLFFGWGAVVLDVAVFEVTIEAFEV
jgi:hypothetical protein